jgi:hypothetical protein
MELIAIVDHPDDMRQPGDKMDEQVADDEHHLGSLNIFTTHLRDAVKPHRTSMAGLLIATSNDPNEPQ